jgi:hypothetical protein
MLEKAALVIRRDSVEWRIYEPDSGQLLGVARRGRTAGPLGIGWLGQSTVSVFEAGDEPLLLTVRRLWGFSPKWEICDADANRVALVRRRSIADPSNYAWAYVEIAPEEIHVRGMDREFARARKSARGLHLEFGPEIQGNPLTKMSVLGAVLVYGEW